MGDLLTEKQMCEEFKITATTAYRWRKQGCPYMGKKGSIRYDKQEVIEWMKNRSKEKEQ